MMPSRTIRTATVFLLTLALPACQEAILSPDYQPGTEISLHVTGGFAGTDFSVTLYGADGRLVGTSCVSFCYFSPGDTLTTLTAEELLDILELFRSAGIHDLDGWDFGNECCDQLHYDLRYQDGTGEGSFRGSSEALPPTLGEAVASLMALMDGTRPLVVNLDTGPDYWPRDALEIQNPRVEGNRLLVRVAYGGGCRVHAIKGVAYGGFMESDPVQVRVLISHDGNDDPCDAYIIRDLAFDLTSLKRAYQNAYGVSDAVTTLRVLLDDPRLASPLGAWVLEYRF